ncbi:MAG: DTW domain-containing protein [Kiritimatiellae bacterium]|nr:DTW domain-containing protein [Kiritimatiellia bacterium]
MNGGGDRLPSRRHRRPRCDGCTLHAELCVCAQLPRVATPYHWILVQHAADRRRPTNTGRLVAAMVENVEVLVFADRHERFDEMPLRDPTRDYLLLFPAFGAEELLRGHLEGREGRQPTLVLLDGTWRQAARMRRRIAALRAMRCVRLPVAAPSSWAIRRAEDPARLCTLETVIRVVALSGREDEARRMWEAMKWIEGRLMYMRGRRPTPPSLAEVRQELSRVPSPWGFGGP